MSNFDDRHDLAEVANYLNKKGDLIYVHDNMNRYSYRVLVCTEANSRTATFVPFVPLVPFMDFTKKDMPIFIGQTLEELALIKGVKITEKENPEYFI